MLWVSDKRMFANVNPILWNCRKIFVILCFNLRYSAISSSRNPTKLKAVWGLFRNYWWLYFNKILKKLTKIHIRITQGSAKLISRVQNLKPTGYGEQRRGEYQSVWDDLGLEAKVDWPIDGNYSAPRSSKIFLFFLTTKYILLSSFSTVSWFMFTNRK